MRRFSHRYYDVVLCTLQIEEYSAHVEEVGGIGNAYYHYVIDMVIESQ